MRLRSQMEDDINIINIIEVLSIIDGCQSINEGALDTTKSIVKAIKQILLKKKPLVSKMVDTEKGLMHYLKDIGLGGSKMMYHAFNAYYNKDVKSKEAIKDLAKSVKKEHLIDVLLKLDVLTLHMVTGPLHIIEAVTGWNIVSKIQNKIEPVDKKVKHALKSLDDLKHDLTGEMKTQLLRYTNALRRVFNVGDFQKNNESTVTGDISSPDIKIGDETPMHRRLKRKKKLKKKK